jgi:hypothetical protein
MGYVNSVDNVMRPVWYRPLMVGLALPPLVFALALFALRAQAAARAGVLGVDHAIMVELGRRWRETGTMYLPYQLSGPYPHDATADLTQTPALYPPVAGPVFALLEFIPYPLWWIAPLAILGYLLVRWRPAPWTWPVMALILAWPETLTLLLVGGTTMWTVALVAAGLQWKWPAAFILLKPSLFPFALVGIRDWRWWVIALTMVAVSLPQAAEYIAVVRNVTSDVTYSVGSVVPMLLPVVAWLGASRGGSRAARWSWPSARRIASGPAPLP